MSSPVSASPEHVDVLVVGAGISGIGAGYHLQNKCPWASFTILEGRGDIGGTWDLFRYPGVRSDSDMHTLGFSFKPWKDARSIAGGPAIMDYLRETVAEHDLERHIRFGHLVSRAEWSSDSARWTVTVTLAATGQTTTLTCGFLFMCSGYYSYREGHTPTFPGRDRFGGQIVHPQAWPEDLDYAGKQVVVIGSGATAATLIPAMAADCGHVTMLQRSPTYFVARPNSNELADTLRGLDIPEEWTHEIVRQQILLTQQQVVQLSAEFPNLVRDELFKGIREVLGEDYDVGPHFTPSYPPWRQRLAVIPDGDLFHSIAAGDASVVTDEIEAFTESGIRLASGDHLEADIVVTATGFELSVLGDIDFSIDDEPLDFSDTVGYRGMMFTGIPNMVWVFGYFRASWTLRAALIADFVCRLLHHLDDRDASMVTPVLRDEDADMELLPWVDPEDFNPGYLTRSMHLLPRQGAGEPWRHTQDYWSDKDSIPAADLDDGALVYD